MALRLELNPALDVGLYARAYAAGGIVRIGNVLAPDSAETVAQIMEGLPWQLSLSESGEGDENARIAATLEKARSGFAYQYLKYPMLQTYFGGKDPGHPIHEVSEYLNGPEFLGLLRTVTGRPDIRKAMASATNFRPGDFLTWHDDSSDDSDTRVVAYTLSFTRLWRADWGGQLLFHDPNGQIAAGLAPAFNCLTLFTVPRAHSVATVAPYAGAPRLSIVGWGRIDLTG